MPEITRERVVYDGDYSSDEYDARKRTGGYRTVRRYRVTPSRVERVEELRRPRSTAVEGYVERDPISIRDPERERTRTVVYEHPFEVESTRPWERSAQESERDIRESDIRIKRREELYGPPPFPPITSRQRQGIRRAATLPVRFDEWGAVEKPLFLRERETETVTRPREIERSPSPVRVRERIVEREESPSPQPHPIIIRERDTERSRIIERIIEYGPDVETEAYSFTFSRHKNSLLSQDSTLVSISKAPGKDSAEASPPSKTISQAGKILHVFSSQYTGEGSIGGSQSANLTLVEDASQPSRKGSQPLFRWVQFCDKSMNLDRFESGCEAIIGLTDPQKISITKFFRHIRKSGSYYRPFSIFRPKLLTTSKYKSMPTLGRTKVRFMMPGILQEPVPRDSRERTSKSGTLTWMCLPYFCLQEYSGSLSTLPPTSHGAHPMRTLLQAHFALTPKKRDLQQAIRHVSDTPPEYCFHIAQVWCLLLNDTLLITCSRDPLSLLTGKKISISPLPDISSAEESGNSNIRPSNLLVSCGKLLWSLPLDECRSWFAFLSHFWEYWPRSIQFLHHGQALNLEAWPELISRATKTSLRIHLNTRVNTKDTPSGILLYADSALSAEGIPPKKPEGAHENDPPRTAPVPSTKPFSGDAQIHPQMKHPSDETAIGSPSTLHPDTAKKTPKDSMNLGKETLGDNFHVFAWLNEEQPETWPVVRPVSTYSIDSGSGLGEPSVGKAFALNEKSLKADLEEIDNFLKHDTDFEERLAYEACPERTRQEIYVILKQEGKKVSDLAGKDEKQRVAYENKVGIMNKAESLFRFFLPHQFEGPTVGKFWGSLYILLQSLSPEKSKASGDVYSSRYNSRVDDVLRWLSYTSGSTKSFRDILSQANPSERSMLEMPEEFPKAWLHLLISLIFSSEETYLTVFEEQSFLCSELLNKGMAKVAQNLTQKSLLEYLVFKPWELVSLINFALLGDVTSPHPDIIDTYVEYLRSLEIAIETNPLDRGHQEKIAYFKQEASAILETLEQQRRILYSSQRLAAAQPKEETRAVQYDLSPAYRPGQEIYTTSRTSPRELTRETYTVPRERSTTMVYGREQPYDIYSLASVPRTPGSQLDPTDPMGVQGLLIQDSQNMLDRKMREFEEMNGRASELKATNIQKIDYNKDRKEAAIYAFTIVTIIFLPLSTIASILGMNVNDIRNMQQDQWVFWAIALPLACIIITLCLIWAGELGNVWRGFSNLWSSRKRPRQYASRRTAYSMIDARADSDRARPRLYYDSDDLL